jgi:hypothetical protein
MTSTALFILLLLVTPMTKADTIQIFNYGKNHLPHKHESQDKNIQHIRYLISNLNKMLEKAQS